MDDQLDGFLSANEPAEAAVEPVEAPPVAEVPVEATEAPPETVERPRGPDGKFIAKGEAPEAPAVDGASPAPTEPSLDHAALIGERRRRQEAEAREAEKDRLIAEFQSRQPQTPPPDFWEDPDQAFNHRLQSVLPDITERIRSELRVERVKESAEEARGRYQDYDQTIDVFRQLAAQNPDIEQQMLMSRDPAEFAYKTAKTHQEVTQYGSIDQLIEAKVAERLKAQPAPVPPIPETLADAQSSRGAPASAITAPPTLDQILGRTP